MPPVNDNWSAATTISGNSGTASGSNVGATLETGEPAAPVGSGGASVWWKWTAATDGVLTVDTFGSSFDTVLDVFTGSSLATLVSVAANDDDPVNAPQSKVSLNVTAGTTYSIRVDGYNGATGSITLDWSWAPPPPPTAIAIVVGASANIWTSTDGGVTWVQQSSAGGSTLQGIASDGTRFVVVGGGQLVQTSTDLTTWTARTTPLDGVSTSLNGVAWDGSSQFVAVGHGPTGEVRAVITSPDGTTWTAHNTTLDSQQGRAVCYAGGLWVALATPTTRVETIHTSPDGTTWTARTSPADSGDMHGVAGNGSLYVAVGADATSTNAIFTSPDGTTWTARSSPLDGGTGYYVAWNGSEWMAVGAVGATAVACTSPDGVTWTAVTTPWTGGIVQGVAWNQYASQWLIAGWASPSSGQISTSPTGSTWTSRQTTPSTPFNAAYSSAVVSAVSGGGWTVGSIKIGG